MQLFVIRAPFDRMAGEALTGAQNLLERAQFGRVASEALAKARHLVNRVQVDRIAAEILTGARARYYLMGLLTLALAAAAGLAAAAIWLGAVLFIDATRMALAAGLHTFSRVQAGAARLSLDLALNGALAAAPALAWFAPGELGVALATAMLCLLLSHAAFTAEHGRLHAVLACAPYALLGFLLGLDAADAGAIAPLAACLLCLLYVAGAALHHVHRASHLHRQDAEWLRQLDTSDGESAAGWEIDYARGTLSGAERLSALLGRQVDYAAIVERGCFAVGKDRALVRAAFSPPRGSAHRIAIEHEAVCADGARVRLRHTGFVRTAPDGEPVRLTCVTHVSDAGKAPSAGAPIDDIKVTADAPLVLVIEDAPGTRDLAAPALTRVGFAVFGADGGEAGLALAHSNAPALVLLDISLPERVGVLQGLKHDPSTRDIPVIVLSVHDDRAHAIALGAAEHMIKPADAGRLAAAVLRYARKRPAAVAHTPAEPGAVKQAR